MADNLNDSPSITTASAVPRAGGTSKLALLASFVAGAFAAWIVISVNTEEPAPIESPPAMTQSVP